MSTPEILAAKRLIDSRNGQADSYLPEPITPKANRFRFIDDDEIERLPPIEYLVEGLIPKKSLAEIHAPPGAGKSFLALDISLAVASGRSWNGREVDRGNVLYVAAEGSSGLPQRVAAWKHAAEVSPGRQGVWFSTQPLQLLERASVLEFAEAVRDMGHGGISLLVIDTFARCFAGGDENSSRDMGVAIDAADLLRTVLDCAVLIIHHTRKDGEVERGSTALRGALDVMMAVRLEGEGELTLSCEKMKDAAEFERIDLQLKPTLNSCVVTAKTGWQVGSENLTKNERAALECLPRDFMELGATLTAWREASGIPDRSIYRVRSSLVSKGYVEMRKQGRLDYHHITGKGRDALPANLPTPANVLPNIKERSLPPRPTPLGGGSMAVNPKPDEFLDLEI